MLFRYRLILSFLITILMPGLILAFQVNYLFTRQNSVATKEMTQILNSVNDRSTALNQEQIANYLGESLLKNNQMLKSLRLSLGLMVGILFFVLSGWIIGISVNFSHPIENIAQKALYTLKVLKESIPSANSNLGDLLKIIEGNFQKKRIFKREEHLVSQTFDLIDASIKEYAKLIDIDRRKQEEIEQLSAQIIGMEEIFQEITQDFDISHWLGEVVAQLSRRFGFVQAGLYLFDESKTYLELTEVLSSQPGIESSSAQEPAILGTIKKTSRLMVQRTERRGEGIPGYVAATGEIYQTADLTHDVRALPGLDSQAVRSEIAIPIRAGGSVMGVLDIQTSNPREFTPQEVAILRVYASQLAIAIDHSRLRKQVEQLQAVEKFTYGGITRQAWNELMRDRAEWGYRSDEKGLSRVEGEWKPWMEQAVQEGKVVVWQENGYAIVSVPIRVRDDVLGVLDFRKLGDSLWTTEELTLAQTLTDQLGQALESARLYQNTQMRAERERILADITSKVRASTNVSVILQTAIRELAEALHVPKGSIQLRSPGMEYRDNRSRSTSGGQRDD